MFSNLHELYINYLDKEVANPITAKLVKSFRVGWANKSDEYTSYLGNNLTGVNVIKFTVDDEDDFFSIFNIDKKQLQKDLHKVKGINKDFKTISNPVYITCAYIMHKVYNSKLPVNEQIDFIKDLFFIIIYKMFSSLNMHYFKYPISTNVAKAINERMTQKFIIKKVNSWQELFDLRSEDVLYKGIHADRLKRGDTNDITTCVMYIQTKLREMFKNHYALFIEVNEQNERIASSSLVEVHEDKEGIKSVTDAKVTYLNNIKSIIPLTNDFVKDDLIDLHAGIFKGIDAYKFRELLITTSEKLDKDKQLYKIVEESFVFCIEYLAKKGIYKDYVRRLYEVMMILKGMYCASNLVDPMIKKIKKDLPKVVKKLSKISNNTELNITTCAFIVYLVVRSFYVK